MTDTLCNSTCFAVACITSHVQLCSITDVTSNLSANDRHKTDQSTGLAVRAARCGPAAATASAASLAKAH